MLKIAVIDDDVVITRLIQEMLVRAQIGEVSVFVDHTLKDGIERIQKEKPDLTLLDLQLPDSEGMETIHQYVKYVSHVPFVVISGNDDKKFFVRLIQAGAQDYLIKGQFDNNLLAKTILYTLERSKLIRSWEQTIKQLYEKEKQQRSISGQLKDRVNELHCLFELSRLAEQYHQRSLKEFLTAAFSPIRMVLPKPEGLAMRISIGPDEYISEPYTGSPLVSASMGKYDMHEGVLEAYKKQSVLSDDIDRHFQHAEVKELFSTLAHRLGEIVMHYAQEEKQRELEEELNQSRRLESIGTLAAGIAHEINTPIQFINDNTQFASNAMRDCLKLIDELQALCKRIPAYAATPLGKMIEEKSKELDIAFLLKEVPLAFTQTFDGLTRVSKIVNAMRDFSHMGSDEQTQVDLNKAIESTLTISHNSWKYFAELKTAYDTALPAVTCYLADINQVVMNIIINAAHAIEETIKAGRQDKGLITVRTKKDGEDAVIEIEDTGTGIPEEVRSKVFDPFFTTKAVGKGTGQGLTLAYSVIVAKHGGSLSFTSECGKGTTFIIRLPLQGKKV